MKQRSYSKLIWESLFVICGILWIGDISGHWNVNIFYWLFYKGFWTLFFVFPCSVTILQKKAALSTYLTLLFCVFIFCSKIGIFSSISIDRLLLPIVLFLVGAAFFISCLFPDENILNSYFKFSDFRKKYNFVLSLFAFLGIIGLFLVIETGIFLADCSNVGQSLPLCMPWSHHHATPAASKTSSFQNVTTLHIDLHNYNLELSTDSQLEEIQIFYTCYRGRVSLEQKQQTLHITQRAEYPLYQFFQNREAAVCPGTLYVKLPSGQSLEQLPLELNRGDTSIDGLSAAFLSLRSQTGDVSISDLVTEQTNLSTGSGTTILEHATIDGLELTGQDGPVSFSGIINQWANLSIGNGDLTFEAYASRDYYTLQIQKGAGDILVDGKDYEDVPLAETGLHPILLANQKGTCSLTFKKEEKTAR